MIFLFTYDKFNITLELYNLHLTQPESRNSARGKLILSTECKIKLPKLWLVVLPFQDWNRSTILTDIVEWKGIEITIRPYSQETSVLSISSPNST